MSDLSNGQAHLFQVSHYGPLGLAGLVKLLFSGHLHEILMSDLVYRGPCFMGRLIHFDQSLIFR
jgi:hypothetical protein